MFDELYNGQTRVTLKMPESVPMYNMRLLKVAKLVRSFGVNSIRCYLSNQTSFFQYLITESLIGISPASFQTLIIVTCNTL